MQSSSFNQVNMILAEVNNVRESVLSAIALSVPDQQHEDVPSSSTEMVNQASTRDQASWDMITAIKDLQKEKKELKSSKQSNNTQGQYRGYTTRHKKSKYCYTHGACAHEGKFCKKTRQGHKDDATFDNKMGGSTVYCQAVE